MSVIDKNLKFNSVIIQHPTNSSHPTRPEVGFLNCDHKIGVVKVGLGFATMFKLT